MNEFKLKTNSGVGMDAKKIFEQVFACNGEDELHKLVTKNQYFKNPDNWYPYGGKCQVQ